MSTSTPLYKHEKEEYKYVVEYYEWKNIAKKFFYYMREIYNDYYKTTEKKGGVYDN
jgi:hypothetical protein